MTTQTEALKLARQLLWRYRHETPIGHQPHMICQEVDEAFVRIDEALAQPEQEPVLVECGNCHEGLADMEHVCKKCLGAGWVNNPQAKEPEQEPVAWIVHDRVASDRLTFVEVKESLQTEVTPLYTTPPQRKPLTDEQEREAFEVWARQDPICWGSLARTKNGAAYRLTQTDCAWNGWLARAAHGIKWPA